MRSRQALLRFGRHGSFNRDPQGSALTAGQQFLASALPCRVAVKRVNRQSQSGNGAGGGRIVPFPIGIVLSLVPWLTWVGLAAVLVANCRAMPWVEDRNTPAHEAAKQFMRGVNLGNYLEAPRGQNWGAHYAAEDFEHIRAEGFDHVRLPIAWHHYTGPSPDFELSDEIFAKADFLVTSARFYKEFREALDQAGIGWAAWDWKAGFKYWDDATGQPAAGMREALFPNANRK